MSQGPPNKLAETGVWEQPGAAFGRQDSFIHGLPGGARQSGETVTIPYPEAAWLKLKGIFKPTSVVVNFSFRFDSTAWRFDSTAVTFDRA